MIASDASTASRRSRTLSSKKAFLFGFESRAPRNVDSRESSRAARSGRFGFLASKSLLLELRSPEKFPRFALRSSNLVESDLPYDGRSARLRSPKPPPNDGRPDCSRSESRRAGRSSRFP